MNAKGEVIEIRGDKAIVKFKRGKACKNCNACLSFSSDELTVEIKNTLSATVGDNVNIVLHERSVLKASLIAYGIPLIAFLAGALTGSIFGDIFTAVGGILGAGISFLILRLLEPRLERISDFQPKMIDFIYSEEKNED